MLKALLQAVGFLLRVLFSRKHKAPFTIVQMLPALSSGGVERGTLEIARAVIAHGGRSIVISSGGRLTDQLTAEGSEHYTLPVNRLKWWSKPVAFIIALGLYWTKASLLHASAPTPAYYGTQIWNLLRHRNGLRFVTSIHALYEPADNIRPITNGEKVIFVSQSVMNHISERFKKTTPENAKIIYRGVSRLDFPEDYKAPAEWLESLHARWPALKDAVIITIAARVSGNKGHDTLTRLIANLRTAKINAIGLIVGESQGKGKKEEVQKIITYATELNIADNLIFTGYQSDMREIYSISDIVVSLTPRPEAFGRSILEALSIGTPVVSWDQGGPAEILNQLFPEGLVPTLDEEALLGCVKRILESGAKPRNNPYFSIEKMTSETIQLYKELIMEKPPSQNQRRATP